MTVETLIAYATVLGVLVGLALWGLKRYKLIAADGHISVGEVLEAIEDAKEEIEDAKEEINEALDNA